MFNAPKKHTKKTYNPPGWFKVLLLLLGAVWAIFELIKGSLFFAISAGLLVALASVELKKEMENSDRED